MLNKIFFSDIRDALQELMHYDDPEQAFKTGWEGWRAQCLRHGKHSKTFFTLKWHDGWLAKEDALDLCDYLKKGWIPVII